MDLFSVSAKAVSAVVAATFDPTLSLPINRTSLNTSERKWADRIVMMLRGAESGELVVCEREEVFKGNDYGEDDEWDFEEPSNNNSTSARHTWTKENMDDAYAYYRTGQKKKNVDKEGCRSLVNMRRKYLWLKTDKDIKALVRYGTTGERPTNRNEQLRLLAEELDKEVTALIDAGVEFHDCNIKDMAMALNTKHDYWTKFKASDEWVRLWKEHYRVTSRHITKIVSVKQKRDEGKIRQQVRWTSSAHEQKIVEDHPDICVWNSDQTGMVKEAHGKRTLARKGVKKVEYVAQSVGATTSSITLLPIIGADGYLKPKLFVQLGERGGKLPQKGCFTDPNLEIAVATSHIMSKESAKQFYRNVLFSGFVPPKLLLILDSWPAFKDHDAILECAPLNCQLYIVNIPPGGTSMCQPADLSFNHQLKGIQRRLKSIVMARQIDFRVSQRDNLLKFVSQLHWSMGADRFKGFIEYGFYKGGFNKTRPAPFDAPKEYMFGVGSMAACDKCSSLGCNLCPRCDKAFCFDCFWVQLHRC